MKKMFSLVLAASLLFSMAAPSFAQAKIYERQRVDQLRALSQFTKNPLALVVQHLAEKLVQNPKQFHLFYEQYIHELETISKKENEFKVPFKSLANRFLFATPIFSVRDEKIYVLAAIRGKHFQTNLALIFSKDGNFESKVEKDFEIKKLLTENEFKVNENWELKDIRRGLSLWPNFLVEPQKEGSKLNFKPNQLIADLHAKSPFKKQDRIKKKSFEPWVKAASILLVLNLTTLLTQGCVSVITEQSSMSVASFPFMNLYFTAIALILLNLYSLITKHQNYFPAFVFYPYFSVKKVRLPDWLFLSNLIPGKGNEPEGKSAQLNEIRASDGESELEPAPQTKINTKHITDGFNKVRLMDVTGVERLGVMGDVQANYLQMLNALEKSGFIDSKGDWIAGSAVLIFDGDLIDGGPNPWEVLQFVYSLQNKASAQGGKVIAVMGNHEYMFLNSVEGRDRYARELIWTHWLSDDNAMTGLNTLKKLLGREHLDSNWEKDSHAELGYAVQNREELLREIHERYPELNNILRWMQHSMPYAVRINENVLAAHAAPDFYARTFEEIASSARGELMTIQDREWVSNSQRVREWMKRLGFEYFVYGHTCQTPIGVGKNGGIQGKVSQIMPKIYNINTTPRQAAEGGAAAVLEFLFDRNLAHTVKVTYGENEFGLEDEIFEHYSVKVYRAFMEAAEKIGAKGLLDFITKNINHKNMVRQSSEGQVYKIEGLEDYELHLPPDIKFDDFKPVQDPFPKSNFGQAVAQLGSVTIHKRLFGVPYSVSSLSFEESPTLDSLYEKHLEIAAGMAQSAYDNLAIDLKNIQDAGYTLDLTNSNNIFIDPEHSRFQPHQLILEKDDSLTHASRLAACLLNHEFAAEKYNGKDPRIFYWRRLILEKSLIAAQTSGLIFSNEDYQNHALFNFDSEMELAFEWAGLKGEWPKVQSRMMEKVEVQKIFSDYPSTLPKKGLVLSSRQRAGLRGFEEIFYSALLVGGIGEIWNHLFWAAPTIGYLIGSVISLLLFMKTHKKPIYLTSEGVLTHAPPLGMDEEAAQLRAKKILFLIAVTLRSIYLLTLYLSPFGNIIDLILATIAAIVAHGFIYNSKLAPRYYWPLAMASPTKRTEFKSEQDRERSEIAARSIKHGSWNELSIKLSVLYKAMTQLDEPDRLSLETGDHLQGLRDRLDLYAERVSLQFQDHELLEYREVLEILIGFLKNEIGPRLNNKALISLSNHSTLQVYHTRSIEIIEDLISFIDGNIEERKTTFGIKEVIEEAFENVFNESFRERYAKRGNEITLEFESFENNLIESAGDRRKILNVFRTLFMNTRQVWQERLQAEAKDNVPPPLSLELSVKLRWVGDKPILEIIDNAGGFQNDGLLDVPESQEPDRQKMFFLNVSERKGGSGLGLAEVWHLIKLHSIKDQPAWIHASNLSDHKSRKKGAKFTIFLPELIVKTESKSEDTPDDPNIKILNKHNWILSKARRELGLKLAGRGGGYFRFFKEKGLLRELKKKIIERLIEHHWNFIKTAQSLGINEITLRNFRKELKIKTSRKIKNSAAKVRSENNPIIFESSMISDEELLSRKPSLKPTVKKKNQFIQGLDIFADMVLADMRRNGVTPEDFIKEAEKYALVRMEILSRLNRKDRKFFAQYTDNKELELIFKAMETAETYLGNSYKNYFVGIIKDYFEKGSSFIFEDFCRLDLWFKQNDEWYKNLFDIPMDYRPRENDIGALFEELTGFSLESIHDRDGVLSIPYLYYAMQVRKSVNPEHKPLVAVYGGAGADISTFLLSTDASTGYFVTQNQVDAEQLKSMMEQWDSITFDDDYAKDKRLYGFGNGGTLDKRKGAIYKAIVQELKTIGVRKESVRIENKDGHTKIILDWVYPGTNQPRTYSITYIKQRLQKIGSPETTDPLLNSALEKGIDIYYQKAVQDTNNLWGQFLPRVAKAIRVGGASITDDYQSISGIHNPEPFLNTESHHFVSLKQNSSKKIFDWWKKIIPSKSNYGWDVTIRIKKEQPQQQLITAVAKAKDRTSGVKAEDLPLVALADLVATDMVRAHIPPEKFAEKAEEYTIARIYALSKMDPKWLEEARDFTITKNLKLIYTLLQTATINWGAEPQVQLAGLIKAYFKSKDFKALLPQFKKEYDHVPSNFSQWLNKNKKIVLSKRFKKGELSKIVSRITGFNPEIIKDRTSVLLLPFVHYAMSVCEIVNPDHKDLVGLYGGAGADISSFLLSTDAGTGYFVTNNSVDVHKLQSYLREWDSKTVESDYTDQEYTYKKRLRGFGEGAFLQNSPENIYWAIAAELKSMGVELNAIEVELDQGDTKLSFNWAHPVTNKNRKYTIFYINSNVESIGNGTGDNNLLNKILDSGIDFYYEKAGMNIHKSWGKFLPRIAEAIKLDGMVIICDFDGDERPIDSMPHLQKLGSKFTSWGESLSMRWWRMFIPSHSGYGWEVKIRKKIRNSIAIQFDTTEWDSELLEFYKLGEIEKLQKIVLEESGLRRMGQAMKAFEYFLQEDLSTDFGKTLFSSIHEINSKKPLAISQSLVSVLEDVLRRGKLSDINSEQVIKLLMWIMMQQPHLISESIRETLEILLERKNLSSLEFNAIENLISLAIAKKRPDRISSLFVFAAVNILNTDNIFWDRPSKWFKKSRRDSLFYSSACDILKTIAKHRPELIFDPMIVRALERVFSYDELEPYVVSAAAQAIEAIFQIHPDFINANTLSVLNSFIHTAKRKKLESYATRHINHAILEIIKKRGNLLFNPDLLSTQEEILRTNGHEDEVYKSAAEFIDIIAENRSSSIQVSTVESLIQSLQRKQYVEAHFVGKDESTTNYGMVLGALMRILKSRPDLVELERLVEAVCKFLKNSERLYPVGFSILKQITLKAPAILQSNHIKILEKHARRLLGKETAHYSQFLKPIADCFKEVSRARADLIQLSTVSLLFNLLKIKDLRKETYMAVLDTFKNLIQKRPEFNKEIFFALEYLMMQKRHEAEEYRYAARLMKKIIKAEPKLENGSVLYPIIKILPEKILGHPFHHWRIYTDNYFRAWMEKVQSNSEAYSVSNAVYELLTFSNLRLSKQNIKKGLDLILILRSVLSVPHPDNLMYGPNVTAINILHQDEEYRKERMETVQILARVKPEQIKTFKGFEQKENALEAIRQSKGPTTIYIHAHGDGEGFSLDSKEVSSQNTANDQKRPIDEPYSISHRELVDTLLERGNLSEVKIIFDCCYPRDLSRTFISYLTERCVSDPDIRAGSPFIITANGEGRFIYTGIFAEGLRSVQKAGRSLYVDDIFKAEDVMFEYEDPIILLPIGSSLFEYMQSKIPKILYSPLLNIGAIFGKKHKDTAHYWEWVYQTPVLSIFSNAIARMVGKKLGVKRIEDHLGEAPYSKTISLISSLVLISSFLTGHNLIIIAASVLWSLASGYVFSGAHKGRESFNLQVVGSILAGVTIAPAILFSLTLNWLGLELPFVVSAITYVFLLVLGMFWNIHLHKEYNENIDEISQWLKKNSPHSFKRFLPSHLSPAIIFSEPSRLKQVEWVKKLHLEENRNLINPMELALADLMDYLDAESFFEEYWWWKNYLSVPESYQFSEDDLTRAFNSYLTELDEADQLIKIDLNGTELDDFKLFLLLNQVEILKSRIKLRWREFGLSHINRVVYQRTGRVFPIDVMISNLNELNPYRDPSESNSIPEELNSLFAKHEDFPHFVERSMISYFGPLSSLQERLQIELKQRILADPALIHKLVRLSSEQFFMLSDPIMDWILNINSERVEITTGHRVLQDGFETEQVTYEGTPYHKIRELLPALNLSSSDTLYDLGSGYGRLPLYTAITTKVGKVKGIEISPERVAESDQVKDQLGLENVEFVQVNIRDYDFSDGTVFYLFNPFNDQTLEIVVNKLKEMAQKKKIRIISWGRSTSYFNQQDWLKLVATVGSGPWPMVLYESMFHSANPEVNVLESKILSQKIIKGILHLESFLDDPDPDVRRMANDVAQRIQAAFMLKEDTPSPSSILEDEELKTAEQSLKSHDEEARCRAVLSLKKHYLAMIAGGKIPDLTLIEERLSDPDFSVRRTAAIALGYLYYMLKKEISQLEKYLEDDEWRRIIGVIALGEIFASNIREGKVLEEDFQKYLLWKANSLPYQEELVTDYLESEEPKSFIDALKRKAEKIIREGFNYNHSQNLWLAFLGIRFNGIHVSWKDYSERMEDVIELDQELPGSFRALFSKTKGLKPIEISHKESKQIDASQVNTQILDEHLQELLEIKERIDSLHWLKDFQGDKDFNLRNLYFIFKREQAIDRGEIKRAGRYRVLYPSEKKLAAELKTDLKLLYKVLFQLAHKKIGNEALRDKCVSLMRDLTLSEALSNRDLASEMMSSNIETRIIAIKNFYEDSIHHLPNHAVGLNAKQIKSLDKSIKELSKAVYAEIKKVIYFETTSNDTYRLIPQGFLSLFRGRSGIIDCSFDRERGFPHTRAMHEDTLYYFVYKGQELKGYVGLMIGIRDDGEKVLTIDTINSPSLNNEEILINLFNELHKVAQELGAIGIALPQNIENAQYFNFENKDVIPKMSLYKNGKKIKLKPVHDESWSVFTEKFGEDRYNSMEAGDFILLDLADLANRETNAVTHLRIKEEMSSFLSNSSKNKEEIENYLTEFKRDGEPLFKRSDIKRILELSWIKLAKRAALLEFLILFQIDNRFVFNGNQIARIMDNAKSPEVIIRTIRFLVQESFSDGAHISSIVSHPRNLKQIKRFINYLVQAAIEDKSHMAQIMSSSMNLKEVKKFIARLYKLGFTNSSHLSQILGSSKELTTINDFVTFLNGLGILDSAQISRIIRRERYLAGIKKVVDTLKAEGILDKFQIRSVVRSTITPAHIKRLLNQIERMGLSEIERRYGKDNQGQLEFYSAIFPEELSKMSLSILYLVLPKAIRNNKRILWTKLSCSYNDAKILTEMNINNRGEIHVANLIFPFQDYKGYEGFTRLISKIRIQSNTLLSKLDPAKYLSSVPDHIRKEMHWYYSPILYLLQDSIHGEEDFTDSSILGAGDKNEETIVLGRMKEVLGENDYHALMELLRNPKRTAQEREKYKGLIRLSRVRIGLETTKRLKAGIIPEVEDWWMKHFPKTPKPVYRLMIAPLFTEGSWLNLAPLLAGELLLQAGLGIVPTGVLTFLLNILVGARFIALHPAGSRAIPIFIVVMNSIALLYFYPFVQWHSKEIVLFNAYLGGIFTHILLNAFQMIMDWASDDNYRNYLSNELDKHKRDIAIGRQRFRSESAISSGLREPNQTHALTQPEMLSQFLSRYPQMERAYSRSFIERHWHAFQSLHLIAGKYADSIFFVALPALSRLVTKNNIKEVGDHLILLGERAGEDYETVYYTLAALKEIITLQNLNSISEETLFLNKSAKGNAGPILSFALYSLREIITPNNFSTVGAELIALHRLGTKNSGAYFWISFLAVSRITTPKNLRSVCLDLFLLDKSAGEDARILFETGFLSIRDMITAENLMKIGLDLIILLRAAKQYKRFLFNNIIPALKVEYGERWNKLNWEDIKNRILKTLEDIHNGVLNTAIFKKNTHDVIQREDVLTYQRNKPIDITDPMVRQLLKNKIEDSAYRTAVLNQFYLSEACEYFDSLVKEDMWNSLGAWKFLKEIYRRFGSLKGKTVIDLYAGPGVGVEQLIRLGRVNAIGIETDPRFVEFAKQFGIPIIHGSLLKEELKTAVEELIGNRKVSLTFSYGLLNNISNRKKRLKILRSISSLTPVGSFSIHGTKHRIPTTNEEFKSAGFRIIEINRERTFVVLFKENEPEDWDAIGFNPLFDDTEKPEDDKEDRNSDKTDESSVNAILSATISALPIFLEPITSSSFYFGQNSWDRLTLETQKSLRRSFGTEPSSNVSISQWLGSRLAIGARINKNPLAIHLLSEKINFARSLLEWKQLDINEIIGNAFTLFRKPNWAFVKTPNMIFQMGGTLFRENSSASNVQSSIEMLARNLNEKAPEVINQKDSIKITVSYHELEKFTTTIKKLTNLFEEKQIELLVVAESPSIKEQEIKGKLIQRGIENLKFRVLIQPKNNGKFDFQELIDAYGLFNTSLILLSGANEWNLDHVLKEIIRIETESVTNILNMEIEKIKLITYSA